MMNTNFFLGIDLGTTNSVLSYIVNKEQFAASQPAMFPSYRTTMELNGLPTAVYTDIGLPQV